MDTPDKPTKPARKPWPMTPIVVVIAIYIVGYTIVNVAYRKPRESTHEPYAEAQDRKMHTIQATMEGWTRLLVTLEPGAPTVPSRAEVSEAPIPERLDLALPDHLAMIIPTRGRPPLHPGPMKVIAPATLAAPAAPRLMLVFPADAAIPPFGEAMAYAKDNHLFLFVQDQTRLIPDAAPVPAAGGLALTLPEGSLAAGAWKASLYNNTTAFTWSFTVEASAPAGD